MTARTRPWRGFGLCPDCAREYADPADRRFHAEPIACPHCGPQLEFRSPTDAATRGSDAFVAAIAALRSGRIVAVKGIGGYHLALRCGERGGGRCAARAQATSGQAAGGDVSA